MNEAECLIIELYEQRRDDLLRNVAKRAGTCRHNDAEDLLQAAMLRAVQSCRSGRLNFRGDHNLAWRWLTAVCKNSSVDVQRSELGSRKGGPGRFRKREWVNTQSLEDMRTEFDDGAQSVKQLTDRKAGERWEDRSAAAKDTLASLLPLLKGKAREVMRALIDCGCDRDLAAAKLGFKSRACVDFYFSEKNEGNGRLSTVLQQLAARGALEAA